jgi:hypothetical protein
MGWKSNTTQFEIDTSAYIGERGVEVSVYIGADTCEPSIETVFDFENLIENHFESYTIGDMIRPIDIPDAELLVIKLEQMAKYARNMLQDYAAQGEEDEKLRGETDTTPDTKYFT